MRRSFRDAIVGLSIVGGMIAFGGIMLWLKGIKIRADAWNVKANFSDATGLSERSPVTYRGILIGEVGEIEFKSETIQATLKIDKTNLRLPSPVVARVVKNSLLGSDVQVTLLSSKKLLSKDSPLPVSKNCKSEEMLCKGDLIEGEPLTSITTLTTELERIVRQAKSEDVINTLTNAAKQFDNSQKELEKLILEAKGELNRSQPIISEMIQSSYHLNNILSAIDNPETLNSLKEAAINTKNLTKTMDSLGSDMTELIDDKELVKALRQVTIGLGQFFNEIYPSE